MSGIYTVLDKVPVVKVEVRVPIFRMSATKNNYNIQLFLDVTNHKEQLYSTFKLVEEEAILNYHLHENERDIVSYPYYHTDDEDQKDRLFMAIDFNIAVDEHYASDTFWIKPNDLITFEAKYYLHSATEVFRIRIDPMDIKLSGSED